MRGGHVSVHHQRLAAEVLIHGLGHLPRARHARAAPLEHVHERGAVGAGAREGDMCRRELEASKPSEGFGREGVGGADGGKPRVTRRAGDAGGSARRVPGPESRPSPARTRSSGSARGPARVARDARSALDLALNRHRREPRARLKKSQFEMSVAKKNGFGSSGTVTGTRSRAFFKAFVPIAKHPPLATPPDAPRLPRAPFKLPRKPSRRPVDPPRDRATRRASSDTRKVSIARKKTLASVQTRRAAADADPRLRRDPTERHHYAITKRSARFAERTV